MWWLSTLGGAFSALGDHAVSFVNLEWFLVTVGFIGKFQKHFRLKELEECP